jgi:hypothetical protein
MDRAGLSILLKELEADCAVAQDAGHKAAIRLREGFPGHLEACAYELGRSTLSSTLTGGTSSISPKGLSGPASPLQYVSANQE